MWRGRQWQTTPGLKNCLGNPDTGSPGVYADSKELLLLLPFMWAMHSFLYYLALSSGCFYLPHHPHIHRVHICELPICLCLSWQYYLFWGYVHILNLCFATKDTSYVYGVVPWLDTPAAFWVPTGRWKMKVRRTVLTALIWGPGGVVTLCGCITLCWLRMINLKSHIAMGIA